MNLDVLLRGQSNAYLLGTFDGAAIISQTQQLLGFDGVNDKVTLEFAAYSDAGNTSVPGTSFLTQWLTPTAAGGWQVAELEQSLLNYVGALPAAQKAEPTAVVWLHSEYDSGYGDLTPATWESAVRYDAALVRAAFGQSPATLPYLFVSAIPYNNGTDTGHQAIRVGMEELAADPAFNASIAARVQDTNMTWDDPNAFGGSHQSWWDLQITASRVAVSLAQEWAAYAKPGSPVALAGGAVDDLGPQVVQASVAGANQLVLKVQFDAASSLGALDATAAHGVGWSVRGDSGVVNGTSATLTGPDTLVVTFDGALPGGGKLYYGYGYGRLAAADGSGAGHAVYDNQGMPIWVDAHGLGIGGGAAVAAPALATGGTVLVGAAGGSFAGTAGADAWVIQPGSGHAVIQGFDGAADTLTFGGIAPGSLMSWNTAADGVPGLAIAWNQADGYLFLPGVAQVPDGHILFA